MKIEVGDVIVTKNHRGMVKKIEECGLYVSDNFFAREEDILELWKPYGKDTYIKVKK